MKILGTLLIIGALFGCYFVYQDYWKEEWKARNPWVKRMAPLIRPHTLKATPSPTGGVASEASYIMIIYMAMQASEDGYNATEAIHSAAIEAGASPSEADLITLSIWGNVQFAKKMDVFTDPKNPIFMERGEPPLAHSAEWESEPLVVGNIISPVLAPELVHALPNMRLVPKVVRDMADDRVDKSALDQAKKWLIAKLITAESYARVTEMASKPLDF
jgi:hypothetical protein